MEKYFLKHEPYVNLISISLTPGTTLISPTVLKPVLKGCCEQCWWSVNGRNGRNLNGRKNPNGRNLNRKIAIKWKVKKRTKLREKSLTQKMATCNEFGSYRDSL